MSPSIRVLTVCLFALPLLFLAPTLLGHSRLAVPGLLVAAIYGWIWLRMRPTRFVVAPGFLEVVWPLKRRRLCRDAATRARLMDGRGLRQEVGWGMRVGAGGLWGGFGWLWTSRRGIVQMYVSRTDRFVWIELGADRPWLITPEHPEAFVGAMQEGVPADAGARGGAPRTRPACGPGA